MADDTYTMPSGREVQVTPTMRSAVSPHHYRIRAPRWLARILIAVGADDGTGDTYEVAFARSGRLIEIVTVQARSEDAAIERARRYLFANIYPLRTEKTEKDGQ